MLTGAEVVPWVLRNLAILMGAYLPALLLAGGLHACIGIGEDGCGAAILFIVPLVWMWLAIPMLLLGGVPILLILAVAWRWPRVARALAVMYPLAFVLGFAEPGWYREHPLAVPVVGLGILYYGFMLCLDPRQREAPWVWWVPVELAVLVAAVSIVGMTGIV